MRFFTSRLGLILEETVFVAPTYFCALALASSDLITTTTKIIDININNIVVVIIIVVAAAVVALSTACRNGPDIQEDIEKTETNRITLFGRRDLDAL